MITASSAPRPSPQPLHALLGPVREPGNVLNEVLLGSLRGPKSLCIGLGFSVRLGFRSEQVVLSGLTTNSKQNKRPNQEF